MNREIKFRAWDGERMRTDVGIAPFWMGKTHRLAKGGDLFVHTNDQKRTLMQYTGLKDKNGVEIYEGDIVGWVFDGDEHIQPVRWYEPNAGFNPQDLTKDPVVEVIGNIYESPELVEAQS